MVEMSVHRIGLDQSGQALVILSDLSGQRLLPILIGPFEANAIAMELRGEKFERPLTHDLFTHTLEALGFRVSTIEIVKLDGGIFYATLHVSDGVREVEIDSRPSDALALALRANARIFVAEEVLQEAQVLVSDLDDSEEDEMARFRELMARVNLGTAQVEPPVEPDEPDVENEDDRTEDGG